MSYERHQVREAPGKGAAHLEIFQQEHSDQRRPDLNLHRVLTGADERFDLERLLERLKKQLDLPTLFVDRGDRAGRQLEIVGDEDHGLLPLLNPYLDAAQTGLRTDLLLAGQDNDFVPDDIATFEHFALGDHSVVNVVLQTGHEIHLAS